MKFATKVFAITLGTSVFTATALSLLLYQALKEYQEQQFTESYQSKLKIIGDTLVQLEKSSDLIAQNAAYALQQLEKVQGLPTNESLTELAKSLHVAHIFATDRDGKFIRSTNGDPSQFKNTLFDYCDGYRGLISGVSPLQQTPILPSSDEVVPGPFKYTMIPSHDRSKILEVSIPLDFIGHTLLNAIRSDTSLIEIALYSPNDTLLGQVQSKSDLQNTTGTSHENSGDTRSFEQAVQASTEECCECEVKGIALTNEPYHYKLRVRVSTRELQTNLTQTKRYIGLALSLSLLIAIVAARAFSHRLLARLRLIATGIHQIQNSGDLSPPLSVTGNDEITVLGQQINQMAQSLQENQKLRLELEHARILTEVATQIAHDIQSPLAALEMAQKDLLSGSQDSEQLLKTAITRIQEITDDLRDRAKSQKTKPSRAEPTAISPEIRRILEEKKLEYRSNPRITFQYHESPGVTHLQARVVPAQLRRILSNLLNNAAESLDFGGEIKINLSPFPHQSPTGLKLQICDSGKGIPAELLPKIGVRGFSFAKEKGTGLGVFHAKTNLESWGATLAIESTSECGTTVTITLPLAKAQLQVPVAVVPVQNEPASPVTGVN